MTGSRTLFTGIHICTQVNNVFLTEFLSVFLKDEQAHSRTRQAGGVKRPLPKDTGPRCLGTTGHHCPPTLLLGPAFFQTSHSPWLHSMVFRMGTTAIASLRTWLLRNQAALIPAELIGKLKSLWGRDKLGSSASLKSLITIPNGLQSHERSLNWLAITSTADEDTGTGAFLRMEAVGTGNCFHCLWT